MTPDQFDALIRSQTPPVDLSPARLDRLAETVLGRLDRQSPPRRFWLNWVHVLPDPRLAMLMIASGGVGLIVGSFWEHTQVLAPQLSTLLNSSFYLPIGS
jgi:hypothetical protein